VKTAQRKKQYFQQKVKQVSSIKHQSSLLFSGSKVVKTIVKDSEQLDQCHPRGICCAVVVATGFSTVRGDLFRDILFPTVPEAKLLGGKKVCKFEALSDFDCT
jgi:magnesium-transporting ATPase (P-type)